MQRAGRHVSPRLLNAFHPKGRNWHPYYTPPVHIPPPPQWEHKWIVRLRTGDPNFRGRRVIFAFYEGSFGILESPPRPWAADASEAHYEAATHTMMKWSAFTRSSLRTFLVFSTFVPPFSFWRIIILLMGRNGPVISVLKSQSKGHDYQTDPSHFGT